MTRIPFLLLAELSLILAVVAFAAQAPTATTGPQTTPPPTDPPTTPPPTELPPNGPTTSLGEPRVDQVPVLLCPQVTGRDLRAGDYGPLVSDLLSSDRPGEVSAADIAQRGAEAVIVLIFNNAGQDPNASGNISTEVGQYLQREVPDVFGTAAVRGFWTGGDENSIVIEAYLTPMAAEDRLPDSATCPPNKLREAAGRAATIDTGGRP